MQPSGCLCARDVPARPIGFLPGWLLLSILPPAVAGMPAQTGEPATNSPQIASPALVPGKPVTSQLNGGDRHFYRITLKKNKFVLVVVEQLGIDVALSLAGAGPSSLITVDSPNGTEGPERLPLVAASSGRYTLEIGCASKLWERIGRSLARSASFPEFLPSPAKLATS